MKNKKLWISLLAGIMALIMILSLILSLLPTSASAASSSEIKSQINELEDEQKELQSQIDALKAQQSSNATEIKEIMEQKNLLDQQVGLLYTQINNLNEQIASYNVLIADKQTELDSAEKRLRELNEKNKERIRAMEEDGAISYWSVLFAANSFSDLLDRLSMIEEIAAADNRRLKEMSEAAQEVENAKVALLTEREELEAKKASLDETQAELEVKSQEAQTLLAELVAKGDEFAILMEDLEDDQNALTDKLADMKVQYDEAKYAEHMATATSATSSGTIGSSGNKKKAGTAVVDSNGITWLVPVDYTVVTSPFGPRTHPITGEVNKMHNGVDLSGGNINGKPIYATRSGVVSYAGWWGSGGWTVKIDHTDGFMSIYMHMTNYVVKAGDYVTAGQVIGYVGSTGGSTGPHLHFEIRYNNTPVNPMKYIG